jgi:hypothetical protein
VSVEPTVGGNRRIDRVLAEGFLDGLRDLPLSEVRDLRTDAEQEEVDLSYLRRMILADEPRSPARGLGRHTTVEPSRADSHRRYVEALVANVDLSDVSARSTDELAHAMRTLSEEEQGISSKRRLVQKAMDACSAEITRRYRDGEADVDALLSEQPPAAG